MEVAYTEFVRKAGKYLEPGVLVLSGRRRLRLVISEDVGEEVDVPTTGSGSVKATVASNVMGDGQFKPIGSVEEAIKAVETVVAKVDPVSTGSVREWIPAYRSRKMVEYGCGCAREEGEMMCKRHGRL